MKCARKGCGHLETQHRLGWDVLLGRHVRTSCYATVIDGAGAEVTCSCLAMEYGERVKPLSLADLQVIITRWESEQYVSAEELARVHEALSELGAHLAKAVGFIQAAASAWFNGMKPQLDLFQRAMSEGGSLVELANRINRKAEPPAPKDRHRVVGLIADDLADVRANITPVSPEDFFAHGFTPHGWACCGKVHPMQPPPVLVVTCGGPPVCKECRTAVAKMHNETGEDTR